MNMVLFNTDLNENNFIPLSNLKAHLLENPIGFFCKYNSSVLGSAYQMIKQYRYIMMLMDIFTHIIMLTPFKKPKQASGN